MTNEQKKKKPFLFTAVSLPIIALLLVVVIVVDCLVLGVFEPIITSFFSTTSLSSEAREAGETLAEQIEEEGIVLTKNDNDVLPLDKASVTKVNVFGWASTSWVQSGSGSGRTVASTSDLTVETDLLDALTDCGIEYNTQLAEMYVAYQDGNPYWNTGSLNSFNYQYSRLYEPEFDSYGEALLADCEAYSDTAFVVLGRVNGESNDAPTVQYKARGSQVLPGDDDRTYLDISTEEEELLTYVGQTYENVVVIINSTNAMNLSFMDEIEGLDSCVIVGCTGQNAASAIPHVLFEDTSDPDWEQVTPSGKTVDTYVRDFTMSAAYVNSGENGVSSYTGTTNSLYPIGTTNSNVGDSSVKYTSVSYMDYQEGIYVGYKWYETADAENFWSSDAANNAWGCTSYEDVVQYPFGYGLSYTEFEWTILNGGLKTEKLESGDVQFTLSVNVTNVGDYPGQDVVELYYTPPYTSGGIEKSAVNLCAFGKTQSTLKPGESEVVTLTFLRSDLASYDYDDANSNAFTGYEVEKGEYIFSLRTDAHTVASDKVVGSDAQISYNVATTIKMEYDYNSGKLVQNLFTGSDAVDGIPVDGSEESVPVTYMTRENFAGTFPFEKTAARAMTQACMDTNLYTTADATEYANEFTEQNPDATMPTTGSTSTDLKLFNGLYELTDLGYELAKDYDAEAWDAVLDQMTQTEMKNLVLHGYIHEEAVASVGKERTSSLDGPNQVGSFNANNNGTGYPSTATAAQSWNSQLIYSEGLALGSEAVGMGLNGLYAPGINIHRSAFGGRNYEYFSEDSLFSGIMCSQYVSGAKNAGCYTYIKHFILYEQDTMRDSIYIWTNEQALREIYLRPFKIAVDNGATGLMSGYCRIGSVWTGGSYALLTSLLRDEWGFKGAVITDYADHHTYMNGDQMIRAGGDLWMDGYGNNGSFTKETTSVAYWTAMRTACKHILYMYADTLATASDYDPETDNVSIAHSEGGQFNWKACVWAASAVIVAGLAVWATFAVLIPIRRKKLAAAEGNGSSDDDSSDN